jgi:hypothetical protein
MEALMETLSREQMDQLAQDIALVKKAIEKNVSILHQIDYRSSIRLVCLISALSVFFFCGLFYVLLKHFHTFAAVPTTLKAIIFCAIALITIGLGILKNTRVLGSARRFEPRMSLMRLLREYYSMRLYHHFIPAGLVLVFACIWAAHTGNARYIIPMCSIGAGLLYNSFDTLLRIDEMLVTGYWLILSGCVVVVFSTISPLLSLSLTLGGGLMLLSVIWYLPQKKRAEG